MSTIKRRCFLRAIGSVAVSSPAAANTSRPNARAPSQLRTFEWFADPLALPHVSLWDAEGRETNSSALLGSPLVLNLWATWCAPCIEELPSLRRLADEARGAFRVVLLNQDRGGMAVARAFLRRHRIEGLGSYADPQGRLYRSLSVRGLPTTFILQADGVLIGRYEGAAQWDAREVRLFIKRLVQA